MQMHVCRRFSYVASGIEHQHTPSDPSRLGPKHKEQSRDGQCIPRLPALVQTYWLSSVSQFQISVSDVRPESVSTASPHPCSVME